MVNKNEVRKKMLAKFFLGSISVIFFISYAQQFK